MADFKRKVQEKVLENKIKKNHDVARKYRGFVVEYINDPVIYFGMIILDCKMMRK